MYMHSSVLNSSVSCLENPEPNTRREWYFFNTLEEVEKPYNSPAKLVKKYDGKKGRR